MVEYNKPTIENFVYSSKDLANADWVEWCDIQQKGLPEADIESDITHLSNPNFVLRKEKFGGLVYKPSESKLYEVNEIGYKILNEFKGDIEALLTKFIEEFEVDESLLRKDMTDFLRQTKTLGLLT